MKPAHLYFGADAMNEFSSSQPDPSSFRTSNGVVCLVGTHANPSCNWGIVRIHGADATPFLHNQFTQDVARMPADAARLAAWCNAKGRMLASFVLVRETKETADAAYLLLCRGDVLPQFVQKLKMFVLRSKVVIEDATASMAAYGLLGEAAANAWLSHGASMPSVPWQCQTVWENGLPRHLVSLYPAAAAPGQPPVPRTLCLQAPAFPVPNGPSLDVHHWEWSETASGVASIENACSGTFVPQMVNFESVGGVSFSKGCYPGQEVVARSQFRGAIKRRGHVAMAHDAAQEPVIAAGDDVWFRPASDAADAAACGTVVQAAVQGADCVVFASLQNQAVDAVQASQGSLHAGSATGPELALCPLPYPLITV